MIIPWRTYQLRGRIGEKILISGILLVVLAGCQSGESCQEILKSRCMKCHSHSTSCAKVGESEQQWLKMIDAMVKLGADISKKERKTLARCLSNPSGTDVEEFCK
ncbi:MAG: hypothetical protein PHI97_03615 [Desulfobulbus sp.]|nr:hypothetical protein [Desulfobulbus sp.]